MLLQQARKALSLLFQAAKGIQNFQLARGVKQRLMLMRAMNIDQPFAQPCKDAHGRGRTIHKLPAASCGRDCSFDDQLLL